MNLLKYILSSFKWILSKICGLFIKQQKPNKASPPKKPSKIPPPFLLKANPDITKTSYLNWRINDGRDIENLMAMADGFLDSAKSLTSSCLTDNSDKKADILIFPILTNLNHGIELYLKAMIWILNALMGNKSRTIKGHDIRQLLKLFQYKLLKYKDNSWVTDFNSKNQAMINYIDEIYHNMGAIGGTIDMSYSRYPFDRDFNSFFYVEALGNIVIDIEKLDVVISEIKDGLEERATYFYDQELNQEW